MKIQIFEMNHSGEKTKVYSVVVNDAPETLYDQFYIDNQPLHKKEVENLDSRLEVIGTETGIMEEQFKTGYGKPLQHHICAFKDIPRAKLRLFFIEEARKNLIILGGGGPKPKGVKAVQDLPELERHRILMMDIEDLIRKAEDKGHLTFNNDGTIESTTNFIYKSEDYEQS